MGTNEKDLFAVLDGIVTSDYAAENLSGGPDAVQRYADACGQEITTEDAERIIVAGKKWLDEQASGNGEWSRVREEARQALS